MSVAEAIAHTPPQEGSRVHWRHWWMVSVLAGLTILSFIDRNALIVLIDDVKVDFGLTDSQSGLLLGAAFAFLYAFAGLPAGYLVDRFDRRILIFGAIVFWSVMTAFSGLATGFGLLLIGRMGVGLGEAFLAPAAGSLIRNALPLERRALAFGILNACSSAGGGLALIIVGGLAAALPPTGVILPLVGQLNVWQAVFLIIGVVGIPLGLFVFTFSEPARIVAQDGAPPATMAFFATWMKRHWRYYGLHYASMAVTGIGTYGFSSWLPSAMARRWGMTPAEIGMTYGTVQIIAGLVGIVIGTNLIHFLMKRHPASIVLVISAGCTLLAAVSAIVAPLAEDPMLAWAMVGLQWLVIPTSGVGAFTALTAATPNASMGKIMALGYVAHSVFGYGLGPSLVAAAAENWFEGPLAISHGISLMCGGALIIAAFLYYGASKHLSSAQHDEDNR